MRYILRTLLVAWAVLTAVSSASGQVHPEEVLSLRANSDETKYFEQLQSVHASITGTKLAFPFSLARYLHARPGQQGALDTNGLEFVEFQHRVILKISGIYKVTFDASQRSRNERASQALEHAVTPLLQVIAKEMPQTADYDGIGFEILYRTRHTGARPDYEGREVLTLIFAREDAFNYARANGTAERQHMLNRSQIFVNGEPFGLALGRKEPLKADDLQPALLRVSDDVTVSHPMRGVAEDSQPNTDAQGDAVTAAPKVMAASAPTFADAMRLQTKYQPQLNAIAIDGGTRFHLDPGTTPSFEISGEQTVLHFTFRNTLPVGREAMSIYKRAAQSLDLFLAPQLRGLERELAPAEDIDALNFSVLNQVGVGSAGAETIDYICPAKSVQAFVANKISTQELISQSVVLVNGVRISLNLQLVE